MNNFLSIEDISDPSSLVELSLHLKSHPYAYETLGRRKTIGLIFLNPSLRTRMSMIKASKMVGLEVMILNLNDEGWKIETDEGVLMDGDKAEHINEAIPVLASYCDLLAFRSFPSLKDRSADYAEGLLYQIKSLSSVPVINMESATLHPLQSLADLVTIREHQRVVQPKIVLSWAPHPRALPQSVANSFLEWTVAAGHDVTVVQPEGFELCEKFTKGANVMHDQQAAFKGADFVYVKNWSAYDDYGKTSSDTQWMVTKKKLVSTNAARLMHCLPVRRNIVISDDALDSDHSIVIQQAANRVCASQSVLINLLEGNGIS